VDRHSVLVTGATSGLGKLTAIRLAERGLHVLLGSRNAVAAEQTAAEVRRRTPAARIEPVEVDLADLHSVARAVERLRAVEERPPLKAVVANAAVQVVDGVRESADGYELTFATNHLGHYLLLTSLLDLLSPGARIVIVSSGTHWGPEKSLGFPAPQWRHPRELADPTQADPSPTAGRSRYATSKLASLLFAYELNRRLRGREITVNAFDPGLMPMTGLARGYPASVRAVYRALGPLIAAVVPGARAAGTSANDLADLVASPRYAQLTGGYFAGRNVAESSPLSHDRALAEQLWTVSQELIEEALAVSSTERISR
jgi:protochlorophyllide reductase